MNLSEFKNEIPIIFEKVKNDVRGIDFRKSNEYAKSNRRYHPLIFDKIGTFFNIFLKFSIGVL